MKALLLILAVSVGLFGAYTRDAATETVYDSDTNLTWQDNSAVSADMNWTEAIDYCEGLQIATADDWRLPNRNELLSITDMTRYDPALNPVFQNDGGDSYRVFWTSTSTGYHQPENNAYYVQFRAGVGGLHSKGQTAYHVRCVRDGRIAAAPAGVSVPLSTPAKTALLLLFLLAGAMMLSKRKITG